MDQNHLCYQLHHPPEGQLKVRHESPDTRHPTPDHRQHRPGDGDLGLANGDYPTISQPRLIGSAALAEVASSGTIDTASSASERVGK